MCVFLDWFLGVGHGLLVVFNLFGWTYWRTRFAHLIVISLTMLSWGVIGCFYGLGYCPLTDWHWRVKRKLGEWDLPNSWIKYYYDRITGFDSDPLTVDWFVGVLGIGAFFVSLTWNSISWWKRRRQRTQDEGGQGSGTGD